MINTCDTSGCRGLLHDSYTTRILRVFIAPLSIIYIRIILSEMMMMIIIIIIIITFIIIIIIDDDDDDDDANNDDSMYDVITQISNQSIPNRTHARWVP